MVDWCFSLGNRGLGFLVELQKLMNLFFYVAVVAGRRTRELDLWFHGEIFWLQSSEFINGGELAPLLFLAEGPLRAVVLAAP